MRRELNIFFFSDVIVGIASQQFKIKAPHFTNDCVFDCRVIFSASCESVCFVWVTI